jgi:hypothetical protein
MRRIKGIVRTVVAIAGAIGLNSPMMVTGGPGQEFTSELNGLEEGSCKIGSQPKAVDHPVTLRGRSANSKGRGLVSIRDAARAECIARRAYALYEASGYRGEDALQHWLERRTRVAQKL